MRGNHASLQEPLFKVHPTILVPVLFPGLPRVPRRPFPHLVYHRDGHTSSSYRREGVFVRCGLICLLRSGLFKTMTGVERPRRVSWLHHHHQDEAKLPASRLTPAHPTYINLPSYHPLDSLFITPHKGSQQSLLATSGQPVVATAFPSPLHILYITPQTPTPSSPTAL